jgi:hypothetical protein
MKEVLEIFKNYFNLNQTIDDEILILYINALISEEDLFDYVKKISINYKKGSAYNCELNEILINPNEIFAPRDKENLNIITVDNLISNYNRKNHIIKNPNIINIYNIFQINHELTHVLQNLIYNEGSIDDWYTGLLSKSLIFMNIDEKYFKSKYYNMFHEEIYSEYDANINGYLITLEILNNLGIKDIDKEIEKFNLLIARNILTLYKNIFNDKQISTPSLNTIKLLNLLKEKIKEIDFDEYNKIKDFEKNAYDNIKDIAKPDNQFERIELGLSINKKTYKYLLNIALRKDKTKNLFNDIRNI